MNRPRPRQWPGWSGKRRHVGIAEVMWNCVGWLEGKGGKALSCRETLRRGGDGQAEGGSTSCSIASLNACADSQAPSAPLPPRKSPHTRPRLSSTSHGAPGRGAWRLRLRIAPAIAERRAATRSARPGRILQRGLQRPSTQSAGCSRCWRLHPPRACATQWTVSAAGSRPGLASLRMTQTSGPCSGRATSHASELAGLCATPISVQQGCIQASEARCAQSLWCGASNVAAWAGGMASTTASKWPGMADPPASICQPRGSLRRASTAKPKVVGMSRSNQRHSEGMSGLGRYRDSASSSARLPAASAGSHGVAQPGLRGPGQKLPEAGAAGRDGWRAHGLAWPMAMALGIHPFQPPRGQPAADAAGLVDDLHRAAGPRQRAVRKTPRTIRRQ